VSLSSALETGEVSRLPGRRDEDWRWTDLRGLLKALPPRSAGLPSEELEAGAFDALGDDIRILAGGAETQAVVVDEDVETTVVLRFLSRAATSLQASVILHVGAGAKLTVYETYEGDGSAYVTNADLRFEIAVGASVERVVLASDGEEGILVSQAGVKLGAGSAFSQTIATTGARRQRLETTVEHPGAGAEVRLDGLYLLAGKRHADLTTTVRHLGVDGSTSQLTKGVVRDQSRGVFQGRIVVEPGADRTEARMGHHALVLSDRAEVDARPELLIHADDVQCAHGNTIGALDEEAIFYMEQRGFSEVMARALLIGAFVSEVADRLRAPGGRDVVQDWIAEHMEVVS